MPDEPLTQDGAQNSAEDAPKKRVVGRPFVKGQVANPGGRPKTKMVTEAIRSAMLKASRDGERQRVEEFGEMIVTKALEGDAQFAKLAAQYLDGMPTQQVAATVDQTIRVIDPLAPLPPEEESADDADG